jgi:hypothetical protein
VAYVLLSGAAMDGGTLSSIISKVRPDDIGTRFVWRHRYHLSGVIIGFNPITTGFDESSIGIYCPQQEIPEPDFRSLVYELSDSGMEAGKRVADKYPFLF